METEVLTDQRSDDRLRKRIPSSDGLGKLGDRTNVRLFTTTHDRHAGENNSWSDVTLPPSKR